MSSAARREAMATRDSQARRSPRNALSLAVAILLAAASTPAPADPVQDADVVNGFTGTVGDDVIDDAVLGPAPVAAAADASGVANPLSGDRDARVSAEAAGTGIDALAGEDVVTRSSVTNVVADAAATGTAVAGSLAGDATVTADVDASATSVGLEGGDGDDVLFTDDDLPAAALTSGSTAEATGVVVTLSIDASLAGDPASAISTTRTEAQARSTGIDGGAGNDRVHNQTGIGITAQSAVTAAGMSLGLGVTRSGGVIVATDPDVVVEGGSLSDAESRAVASASAIDGGDDADDIDNSAALTVVAGADATTVDVSLDIAGSLEGDAESGGALTDSSTAAEAVAVGIAGAAGADQIVNRGTIFGVAGADTTAVGVSAGVTVTDTGRASGSALSDAGVAAAADVRGLDGGDGADSLTNLGTLTLGAQADATAVSVALALGGAVHGGGASGAATSDSTASAVAAATGLAGGAGDDAIENRGATAGIGVLAGADATAVGVGLTVTGQVLHQDTGSTGSGDLSADVISNSRATTAATSVAIAGDTGADAIVNDAGLSAVAGATATAVSVGAGVDFNVGINVKPEGDVSGTALSDAGVASAAAARGIDAGDDADSVVNRGVLVVTSAADTTGVAVGLTIAGKVAYAEENGDGDSGDGDSEGEAGNVAAAAFSNARAEAEALAAGVAGGAGADDLDNTGAITASAEADATAVAASVAVGVNVGIDVEPEGDVSGAALSDAGVGASTTVAGVEGGAGNDVIENGGALNVLSDASATGVAVGLTVAGNVSYKGEDEEGGGENDDGATNDAEGDGDEPPDTVKTRALSDASTQTAARATGIVGGGEDDSVTNFGRVVRVHSVSEAVGVAASLDVAAGVGAGTDAKLDVSGAAVSDASVAAEAATAGIDGGSGADRLTNFGEMAEVSSEASATGVAASLAVSGNLAYKGGVSGKIEGEALSDSSTTAAATTAALAGGDGDDVIASRGNLGTIRATADAVGVSASLDVTAGLAIKGDVEDASLTGRAISDASVASTARALAVDGGDGADSIQSTGHVDRVEATSNATGVAASLDVTGSFSYKGDTDAEVSGQAVSDSGVGASAFAAGIDSGAGADEVVNAATFGVVRAEADAVAVSAGVSTALSVTVEGDSKATVEGRALATSDVVADAAAVGVTGGAEDDSIVNTGDLTSVESDASATGVSAGLNVAMSVTIKGNSEADVTGGAVSDTSVAAEAFTAGLAGDAGGDAISNSGALNVRAGADATGVAATLTVAGAVTFKGAQQADVSGTAASDARVTAAATAIGIDGGAGADVVENSGAIALMTPGVASADAVGVSASLSVAGNLAIKGISFGGASSVAGSNADVTAEASATGIDGGDDGDSIHNSGAIVASPTTEATGVAASLSVAGTLNGEATSAAFSEANVTARSRAAGIAGGSGDDDIANDGDITLMKQAAGVEQADAEALAVAVTVDVAGALSGGVEGGAVTNARATTEAAAAGIDGGAGADSIGNTAAIVADVDAQTDVVAVGVELKVTGRGSVEGGALTDASARADAAARGIAGGAGDDWIQSAGAIALDTNADAVATSVSVALTGTATGLADGKALADGSALAAAQSVGLDGGTGGDLMIATDATIDTVARSSGRSRSVSVNITGAVGMPSGAAVADASVDSESRSVGIAGGAGADTIASGATISATAGSSAAATSTSVGVTFGAGVASNTGTSDTSATARASAVGLEGGDDDDTLVNAGTIFAGGSGSSPLAMATSGATTVAVTLGAGYVEGDTSATAASRAEADAAGLRGGGGNDFVQNTGVITIGSKVPGAGLARASSSATAVDVGITVGANANRTSSDTSATALASAAGISGGAGNDTIENSAKLDIARENGLSAASANARSVRVGVTLGASLGETASNSSANAVSNVAGIGGDAGADRIVNSAAINVGVAPPADLGALMTVATAGSDTVDVGVTLGGAFQDVSADASATAVTTASGIAGGDDADVIDNTGDIHAYSSAGTIASGSATKASLSIGVSGGGATSNASTTSLAASAGIDGGAGADEIRTAGDLDVRSWSSSTSASNSSNLNFASLGVALQSAEANSSASANAQARGVDGGAGADLIRVGDAATAGEHELDVAANATVSSLARSSSVTGLGVGAIEQHGRSRAETTAHALAVGIDGGEGDDDIVAASALNATATTAGSATGTSSTSSGFTLGGTVSGESVADARATVLAESVGIRGGEATLAPGESDADEISSVAPIDVTAISSGTSSSSAAAASPLTLAGSATGEAVADASAVVLSRGTGIEGGAGGDVIAVLEDETAQGKIDVRSESTASVTSRADANATVVFGDASTMGVADASATIAAESLGISGGAGDDTITSRGGVRIGSLAAGTISAESNINASVAFGSASTGAVSDASAAKFSRSTGIDGGSGADTISNESSLEVTATSGGTVSSRSTASSSSFFRSASSSTLARAGLDGTADAEGIVGGDGDDAIENLGAVHSYADSDLNVASLSFATAKSTFGDASAVAGASAAATGSAAALGLAGGAGADEVTNAGELAVTALGNTAVTTMSVAIARSTFGDESTTASSSNFASGAAVASGIDGADGGDTITNSERMDVTADARVSVASLTVSSDGPAISDARTIASASATGLGGGAGSDVLANEGDLLVSAAPRVLAATRTQAPGSFVGGQLGVALTAASRGISGGDGDDVLGNSGGLRVLAGRQSDSTVTTAMASGSTVLRDSRRIGADSAALLGKRVRIVLAGATPLYTTIVGFDAATGALTLSDAVPQAVAAGNGYTIVDLDDGASDIAVTTLTAGGAVFVDASTLATVDVAGLEGGGGRDEAVNDGDLRATASNAVQVGQYEIGASVAADLRSTSSVVVRGIAAESVRNEGSVESSADALLRADGAVLTILGSSTNQLGLATTQAFGIEGDATLANSFENRGTVGVASAAETRSVGRVVALFSTGDQALTFAADSSATGTIGGADDDVVLNRSGASVEVDALATSSIQGVSTSFRLFGIGQRTENIVDAAVDATAHGFDLGGGTNLVDNAGTLAVRASARPSSAVGAQECGAIACLARAVSDIAAGETSASAVAASTARARGIFGEGSDRLGNSGSIDVLADALATSFAQAGAIVAAQDQSSVSSLSATVPNRFTDQSLQGIAETALLGKRLRFPNALDLDFLEAESIVGARDSSNTAKFTDTTYAGTNPVGMRVRFADAANFVTTVTAFDAPTGVFTVADAIPTSVAATEGYSLSVLTAEVTAFDSATGEITLSNALPDAVAAGDRYTLSIVSELVGTNSFRDTTRSGETVPAGAIVTFAGVTGYSATITAFDADTGTFTLSTPLPDGVTALDVYTLSSDASDGHSGSDAQAFATGVDLGGGDVQVVNGGRIDVHASATADTRAAAPAGRTAAAAASGVAEVRGIRTHGGDDYVENDGTIDVAAEVAAASSTPSIERRALAVGIETGAGNDIVINGGAIAVTASLGGGTGVIDVIAVSTGAGDDTVENVGSLAASSAASIAIDTGAGADLVTLGAVSDTVGRVLLGDGDDGLTLVGGASVTTFGSASGAIDAGFGTDRLTLEGAGNFAGTLGSFEQLVKREPGTFVLSAVPTLELLAIDAGVVRVDDDYAFGAGSLFRVPISGNGEHGRLSVLGGVTLAGRLEVTRQAGPYFDGSVYDIVVADGSIAAAAGFGSIELPAPSALVQFDYRQLGDRVQVIADVEHFSAFASDPIQRSTAQYLDRLLPTATGGVARELDHLQTLAAADLPPSYAALSPAHYGVTRRLAVDTVSTHLRSLEQRMSVLRLAGFVDTGDYRGAYARSEPIRLAQLAPPSPSTLAAAREQTGGSDYGVWLSAYGAGGARAAEGGYADYDTDGAGMTLGFDMAASDDWLLGLSLGRARTDLEFDGNGDLSDLDMNLFSIYGSWTAERAYVDAMLLLSDGTQDDRRSVAVVGDNRLATASHDLTTTALSVDGAYDFGGRDWSWGPFGALRYVRVQEDAFTETGAGDLSLVVQPRNTEALLGDVGVRIWRTLQGRRGRFVPELGLSWVHDFDLHESTVDVAFVGAPGLGFAIPAQSAEADGVRVAFGLGYVSRRGFSTLLRYAGEFRGDSRWQGLQGELRYEF